MSDWSKFDDANDICDVRSLSPCPQLDCEGVVCDDCGLCQECGRRDGYKANAGQRRGFGEPWRRR